MQYSHLSAVGNFFIFQLNTFYSLFTKGNLHAFSSIRFKIFEEYNAKPRYNIQKYSINGKLLVVFCKMMFTTA